VPTSGNGHIRYIGHHFGARALLANNRLSRNEGQVEMDGIDLLVAQHRRLENLLRSVLDAFDEKSTPTLFAQAGDELTVHVSAEEAVFYPAVKARGTEDILLESLEEHLSLKRVLADLLALAPSDRTFEPKFKVLKEQVEHHHKEEEEHLFPKVKALLNAREREMLGSEMRAHQERLRLEGQPRVNVVRETGAAARLD
jgi:hemerythrin superfamily protein